MSGKKECAHADASTEPSTEHGEKQGVVVIIIMYDWNQGSPSNRQTPGILSNKVEKLEPTIFFGVSSHYRLAPLPQHLPQLPLFFNFHSTSAITFNQKVRPDRWVEVDELPSRDLEMVSTRFLADLLSGEWIFAGMFNPPNRAIQMKGLWCIPACQGQ